MEGLTIGEVARQCELTPETIRFYEREGLIPAPARQANGYRAYTSAAVKRLQFIKRAKSLGFSLKQTEELLDFSEDSHSTAAEFKAEAQNKCREIEEKINDLTRVHEALKQLVDRCPGDGDKPACPILNALNNDELAMPLRSTFLVLIVIVSGCATSHPSLRLSDMNDEIAERLNVTLDPTAGSELSETVDSGEDHLTLDEAIAFAVNNNLTVRKALNAVGMAESELLAAGVLPNPVIGISSRVPDGPPSGMNFELNLFGSLIELLQRPQATQARAAEVDTAILKVGVNILSLAADVESAYIELRGAHHKAKVLSDLNKTASASSTLATELHRAGNLSALNKAQAQAYAEQTEIELLRARLEVDQRRARLAALMGLGNPDDIPPTNPLQSTLPATPATPTDPLGIALQQRLDLAAAEKLVVARTADLGLAEDWGWLQTAQIGISAERDTDRQIVVGPSISGDLPIFNRGDAAKSKAAVALQASELAVNELKLNIENEVYRARQALNFQHAIAERYADKLLPVRRQINELSQKHYNYMLISSFDVIAARAQSLRSEIAYIDALTAYWRAEAAFRRAIGGRRGPAT